MRWVTEEPTREVDVVVAGSGAAGLTAALVAADSGARVSVLEKSAVLGGTSAISGGMLWIPQSGLPHGTERDLAAARQYVDHITKGRASASMVDRHLGRGPAMIEFFTRVGGPEFTVVPGFPDYHAEFPGGAPGGRSIEPELYEMQRLNGIADAIRADPRPPFRQQEYFEFWGTYGRFPQDLLDQRELDKVATRGRALVGPLVEAIVARDGALAVDAPVERLIVDDARVIGVRTGAGDVMARYGVVLACGGFEWNADMCNRFLSGPVRARCSPPTMVGDGIRMAMAVGSDVSAMNEAWWGVMADIPGLEADGEPLQTMTTVERSLPGSILVNRTGRRFANEATSYGALGKVLAAFDANQYGYSNLPAFLIADARHVKRYGIFGASSLDDAPEWLNVADTLAALAAKIDVNADGLAETVERFNHYANEGLDPDFHRGEHLYDRYLGDGNAPHPNLAPLDTPPFAALEVTCGAFGTRGGVRTDEFGRALTPFSEPIPGLFAAGNNAAHPIPFGYMGAGSTLGPGMTMAYAAGQTILGDGRRAA